MDKIQSKIPKILAYYSRSSFQNSLCEVMPKPEKIV